VNTSAPPYRRDVRSAPDCAVALGVTNDINANPSERIYLDALLSLRSNPIAKVHFSVLI
jgi:hypothetical protein